MNEQARFCDDHPLVGAETEIQQLIECGQLFHSRGWSVGTSSNYSIVANHDPLELIVTASGKDKGRLDREDFVRINQLGKPICADQPKSSAETMLHVVLAQSPDVGAILHTHSIWGTLLSDFHSAELGFEISGYEMLKGLSGIETHESSVWLPIFENTQDIDSLSVELKNYLDSSNREIYGFLIRNHGLYTWGCDVFSARRQVEILEFLFEVIGRKTAFGR